MMANGWQNCQFVMQGTFKSTWTVAVAGKGAWRSNSHVAGANVCVDIVFWWCGRQRQSRATEREGALPSEGHLFCKEYLLFFYYYFYCYYGYSYISAVFAVCSTGQMFAKWFPAACRTRQTSSCITSKFTLTVRVLLKFPLCMCVCLYVCVRVRLSLSVVNCANICTNCCCCRIHLHRLRRLGRWLISHNKRLKSQTWTSTRVTRLSMTNVLQPFVNWTELSWTELN